MLGLQAGGRAGQRITQFGRRPLGMIHLVARDRELHPVPRDFIQPLDGGRTPLRNRGDLQLEHRRLARQHLLGHAGAGRQLLTDQPDLLLGPIHRNRLDGHDVGQFSVGSFDPQRGL